MVSGVYWSVGGRSVNEDTVALESVYTDRGKCTLIAVCDGVGSLKHGEIASGYVTECLIRWFYRSGINMSGKTAGRIKRSLCRCIYDCHMELKETAGKNGIVWGSTCTCVCIWGKRYVCMHLGDTSAYVLKRMNSAKHIPGIKRITDAHVNDRGELIKCVGSMGYYEPDISMGRLNGGDGILVVSDGFRAGFSDEELGESMRLGANITEERIEHRLAGIADEADRRGCKDNQSAVCVVL